MVRAAASGEKLSPQRYLELERGRPEEKHEFYEGDLLSMGGASRAHNLIAANIARELGRALRERACEVYQSDMRVKVAATGLYTYPDVVAAYGPSFEDTVLDTLLNPQVIVEVLSDSSEAYDRGKKFDHYRRIESLAEYVLVSQTEILVEHFARQPEGAWLLSVRRAGDRLALESIACELDVDEIYAKVFERP